MKACEPAWLGLFPKNRKHGITLEVCADEVEGFVRRFAGIIPVLGPFASLADAQSAVIAYELFGYW